MKTVSLSGSPRENVGSKGAADLRNSNRVPGVIYGGEKQVHFSVDENELNKIVFSPNVYQVDLEVDGTTYSGVIQDIQWHPVTDRIVHIDVLEFVEGKAIRIKLPVALTGNSIGVRNGGKLQQPFRKLTLKGLPNAFPDNVAIDVTELKIGGSVRVRDLDLPGLTINEPAGAVVVSVKTARGAVAADEEEEEEAAEAEAEA